MALPNPEKREVSKRFIHIPTDGYDRNTKQLAACPPAAFNPGTMDTHKEESSFCQLASQASGKEAV